MAKKPKQCRKTLTVVARRSKKQRRRSRRVMEGRIWNCVYCSKSYLSMNSLVFHVRKKHISESDSRSFIQV